MLKSLSCAAAAALLVTSVTVSTAQAEWKPNGPIKLMIGFKAGGGTDTQARLIGEELSKKKGWKFIFKNVTGKMGGNLARVLKKEKNDGLTIGMAIIDTFAYGPQVSKNAGYTAADFDYLLTTAPSQVGVVTRTESGWKTIDDLIKTAKSKKLKFGYMTDPLGDAVYLIGKKYGVKFNQVSTKGGRGVMNALVAKDIDIGFIGGIHAKAVKAGQLINLASAEDARLTMSPDAPTLKELGIPYSFGFTFVVVAPKGIPADAKATITNAMLDLINDKNSKSRKLIERIFGTPPLDHGSALDKLVKDSVKARSEILAQTKK